MCTIIKQINSKLHSKAGETIGETLVALLISALALTMLAGAIFASSNLITKSRKNLNVYYNKAENLATFSDVKTGKVTIDGVENTVKVAQNGFGKINVIAYIK